MQFRDWLRKYQRDNGFIVAWGGAYLTVWAMFLLLAWLASEQWTWLFEGVQDSTLMTVSFAGAICVIRRAIITRRLRKDDRKRYPSVSPNQVLDLYLRFIAAATGTAGLVLVGLFALRRFHWLSSWNALIVLVVGLLAGWVLWALAGRSLQPYPID